MADSKPNILITGMAGFIGFHLAKKLAKSGYSVYGIDNLNSYYPVTLKMDRLKNLGITDYDNSTDWTKSETEEIYFQYVDLGNRSRLSEVFHSVNFDAVVHLAAQPGVRLSITQPDLYMNANIIGTYNLLEVAKSKPDTKLILASSSSVYGVSEDTPYKESQNTDAPVSLYAATKKSTEIIAHYYAHQYKMDTTMLRFFTVYGPWGRPDMAVYGFFQKIVNNQPISVYNNGELKRDFTYIDDIVESIEALIKSKLTNSHSEEDKYFHIFNIGNQEPVKLLDFISLIEMISGKTANKVMLPMQPGDVFETYSDSSNIQNELQIAFNTPLKEGLTKFYGWFENYHQLNKTMPNE